jgi:hypothetical protein
MKVKSLSFNRSSGRDGAVKTAIKLKQHPTLCPLTRQNRPLFEVPIKATDPPSAAGQSRAFAVESEVAIHADSFACKETSERSERQQDGHLSLRLDKN